MGGYGRPLAASPVAERRVGGIPSPAPRAKALASVAPDAMAIACTAAATARFSGNEAAAGDQQIHREGQFPAAPSEQRPEPIQAAETTTHLGVLTTSRFPRM